MTEALAALQVAGTDEEITAAYRQLAEVWNDEVPSVALNQLPIGEITEPDVMGIEITPTAIVMLDDAWLAS